MAEEKTSAWHVLVDRDDITRTSVVPALERALDAGEARLAIDAFGLTANNVTYAAYGDMIGYWNFFPADDTTLASTPDADTNWGRVPVWGFADVVESNAAGLEVGARVYGYLPMSTELIVTPERISEGGFVDASAHRAALPMTYNRYSLTTGDAGYSPELEDAQMLLRPLFFTSFLIDDFLDDNGFFVDEGTHATVIATSASSKTAFGTAELLAARDGVTVVGLTSPGNVKFCEQLGTYDTVLTYDDISSLEGEAPSVLIDFAGNRPVVAAVHARLGDALRHSAVIGGTHWDVEAGADPMEGPEPTFFFAPSQIEKRHADWGPGELDAKLQAAWVPFVDRANELLTVVHEFGADAIAARWADVVDGATPPSITYVMETQSPD